IHLTPLYRINGQDDPAMPGVLALTPPKNAARGREQDRLVVYLLLTGNSTFTTTEYMQLAEGAGRVFYETPRALTSALRAATQHVNQTLLERNMSTSSQGKYALGWLLLAAVREAQCTFSISGQMQAYWFGAQESRHFNEPTISGKGLGSSQNINIHYAQTTLEAGNLLLLCGRVPGAWVAPLNDAKPSSLDAMRRRLTTLTSEDLNAVLIQATDGAGMIHFVKNTTSIKEEKQDETPPQDSRPSLPPVQQTESTPAHVLQPSAYAIPIQKEEPLPQQEQPANLLESLPHQTVTRDFPASIPRAKPSPVEEDAPEDEEEEAEAVEAIAENMAAQVEAQEPIPAPVKEEEPETPREPSVRARQAAKAAAVGIQSFRRLSGTLGDRIRHFLPRLLPNPDTDENSNVPSTPMLAFMAALIPLVVVTVLVVVYLRIGRSQQYDAYLRQAQHMREQAISLSSPVEQRKTWENVLLNVERAEEHRQTNETINLRKEAEANLDKLLGITRMQFSAAFSSKPNIKVSRMAASDRDLFLLNAETGEAVRAFPTAGGRGFQLDTTFNCKPGVYGSYTVGPLVDILTLPVVNFIDATLLGIDASGNLLYCAPGQVAQAIPLPPPDTNWGRVTGFALDNGTLYVLDASSRAVWVYNGRDGTYVDRPYFFFGQQTPSQDVIDFIVSGDEMYLLHSDGRLSTCSFSRIQTSASNCQDPLPKVNPLEAYQDIDLFGAANFTQMLYAAQPDQSILLLDADSQSVLRFSPRMLEFQNQFRPTTGSVNPIPAGSVGAVAVSPDHVLYLAVNGQVYFALNMP
ncbi:MAG: hypothetical protein Q8L87_14195, partial [Anaerolineales bacterium]|nr:hypothetical protein [Anaerolineales bacterium]